MLDLAQKQILKAAIIAHPSALALWTAGDFATLKEFVNAPTATKAWRVNVSGADLFDNLTIATFDNIVAGKRDALRMMMDRGIDCTKKSMRDGLADIFAVTGGYTDSAQLAKMLNGACTEFATWAEVALGSTTPAAVGGVTAIKRNVVGALSVDEVSSLQAV
jgi:hypothetical protein